MNLVNDGSLLSLEPILVDFLFAEFHATGDVCAIFRFAPMQNLSLGITRLLEKCLLNMLSDENRTTCAMETVSGSRKLFRIVKTTFCFILDRFLSNSYTALLGSGLCIDYRKPGQTNLLNGLLTETDIARILEASWYDAAGIVLPFCGAIVDECYALNKTADITSVFTNKLWRYG